ncbi:adenylate kinase 7-like, partial [Prorops nasuta]|uniref:adenylate kinase 7-like n=1 Tax=Prorops nasuta TaxID=863751 RepID=UPI0034CDE796
MLSKTRNSRKQSIENSQQDLTRADSVRSTFTFVPPEKPRERQLTLEFADSQFQPWKIFINHIDTYHNKKLAQFLVGLDYYDPASGGKPVDEETAVATEEDEEAEENENLKAAFSPRMKYRIIATVRDKKTDKKYTRQFFLTNTNLKPLCISAKTTLQSFLLTSKVTLSLSLLASPILYPFTLLTFMPPQPLSLIYRVFHSKILYDAFTQSSCPENMKIIDPEDKDKFLSELLGCGIIIYDITLEPSQIAEASWVLQAIIEKLEDPKEQSKDIRYFVLISTIMTWARTKPLDPEDPDLPLTEADFRKRRPHPNYKQHIQLEREVVAVKKAKNLKKLLKTLVICSGVTYGDEEGPLHALFKMAWLNQDLFIVGKGDNKIPLVHVRDLITIISKVLLNWPKKLRYILAVEQEVISQAAISKSIAKAMGSGKTKRLTKEEALLLPEVTQEIYDTLTLGLKVDAAYIVDILERWHFDTPFRDSIRAIVREYKAARNLHPIKIVVLGPPASGKTRVARYLAEYYRLPLLDVKSLITDAIEKLSLGIEVIKMQREREKEKEKSRAGEEEVEEEEGDEGDEDQEESPSLEDLEAQLDEIRKNISENNGRLDDATLNKLLQRRLQSKDCQNQGYILDGYPKTLEQAKHLFPLENIQNDDLEEEEDLELSLQDSFMPNHVVVLIAEDEFLINRIACRPEKEIQHTHYSEEHMMRRLQEYRERNTEDTAPMLHFDEIEVHPVSISVEEDTSPDMLPTINRCIQLIGKPKNYGQKLPCTTENQLLSDYKLLHFLLSGLSAAELAKLEKVAEEEARAAELAAKLSKEREALEMKKIREQKMFEWTSLMEKLKQEEEEQLCLLGEPLRQYLMKHIFPTLTQGLIQVAKLRPDDPVDFLAEYLFKENPEGRMFEPDYTETMSVLLKEIESLREDILPEEELDD